MMDLWCLSRPGMLQQAQRIAHRTITQPRNLPDRLIVSINLLTVEHEMKVAIPMKVPMVVEMGIGGNWLEAH